MEKPRWMLMGGGGEEKARWRELGSEVEIMEEVGDMDARDGAGDLQRRHPTRIRRFPRSSACRCPDLGRSCLGPTRDTSPRTPSFAPSSDRYGPAGPFRLLSKPRSLAAA